jgi:hypothetical protein
MSTKFACAKFIFSVLSDFLSSTKLNTSIQASISSGVEKFIETVYCPFSFESSINSHLYFHIILSFNSITSGLYKKEKEIFLACLIGLEDFKDIIFLFVSKYRSDLFATFCHHSIIFDFKVFQISLVDK